MDLCLAVALGPEPCLCGGMNHYNNCDNRGGAMGMEQGWWNKLTVNFGLERSFRRSGQDSLLKAVFQCFNTPSEQVKGNNGKRKTPYKMKITCREKPWEEPRLGKGDPSFSGQHI